MPSIVIVVCDTIKRVWGSVEPSDVIVYESGVLYYVESIAVEEPSHVTLKVRCVVAPDGFDLKFWDVGFMSVGTRAPLPAGITIVKGA